MWRQPVGSDMQHYGFPSSEGTLAIRKLCSSPTASKGWDKGCQLPGAADNCSSSCTCEVHVAKGSRPACFVSLLNVAFGFCVFHLLVFESCSRHFAWQRLCWQHSSLQVWVVTGRDWQWKHQILAVVNVIHLLEILLWWWLSQGSVHMA